MVGSSMSLWIHLMDPPGEPRLNSWMPCCTPADFPLGGCGGPDLALELGRARSLDVLREGGEEAVPQHAQVRELVPRGHELAALKMAKSPVYSLAPLPV